MFSKLFGLFSKDLGIDLGTANTLVYIKDKGIYISEPSVVAINQKTGQILSVGEEAKKMLGRTPAHISVIRPLVNGVISDFEVTETMLRDFIGRAHQDMKVVMPRPRVVESGWELHFQRVFRAGDGIRPPRSHQQPYDQ